MEDQRFPDSGFGLSEAIQAIRRELQEAHEAGSGLEPRLPLVSVTVELQVAATREAGGRAGFRVPVVDLEIGGTVGWQRLTTHTVRVVLGPPPMPTYTVGSRANELEG